MTRPTHYDPSIAGLARIVEVSLDKLDLTIQKYRVLTHLSRGPASVSYTHLTLPTNREV